MVRELKSTDGQTKLIAFWCKSFWLVQQLDSSYTNAAFPILHKAPSTTGLPKESGETVNANKAQAAAQDNQKTDDGRHVNTFKQNKQRNQTSQITF